MKPSKEYRIKIYKYDNEDYDYIGFKAENFDHLCLLVENFCRKSSIYKDWQFIGEFHEF